jgi:hypothetical protein
MPAPIAPLLWSSSQVLRQRDAARFPASLWLPVQSRKELLQTSNAMHEAECALLECLRDASTGPVRRGKKGAARLALPTLITRDCNSNGAGVAIHANVRAWCTQRFLHESVDTAAAAGVEGSTASAALVTAFAHVDVGALCRAAVPAASASTSASDIAAAIRADAMALRERLVASVSAATLPAASSDSASIASAGIAASAASSRVGSARPHSWVLVISGVNMANLETVQSLLVQAELLVQQQSPAESAAAAAVLSVHPRYAPVARQCRLVLLVAGRPGDVNAVDDALKARQAGDGLQASEGVRTALCLMHLLRL